MLMLVLPPPHNQTKFENDLSAEKKLQKKSKVETMPAYVLKPTIKKPRDRWDDWDDDDNEYDWAVG